MDAIIFEAKSIIRKSMDFVRNKIRFKSWVCLQLWEHGIHTVSLDVSFLICKAKVSMIRLSLNYYE